MERLRVALGEADSVSALLDLPADPRFALALAHGAGAGMEHPFMAALAGALSERGVATLRYNFPSMERGAKRPDTPAVAHHAVRAEAAALGMRCPGLPLFAGGKSFGGRMTSQAQAAERLPGVRGLVFVGFPLHAAKKPSTERAAHLGRIVVPMLFLQGTRDALAGWPLIEGVTRHLGARATLARIDEADHAFHVPARSGRNDGQVLAQLAGTTRDWMGAVAAAR